MKDILPDEMPYWHLLEAACQRVCRQAAYQEVRMPLVESTDLFARSVGGETDIVAKEMYTFNDLSLIHI